MLNMTHRKVVLLGAALMFLIALNFQIWQKEKIVANGTTMLLQLAPNDPRSLLQGDYMTLRYQMARRVAEVAGLLAVQDGSVVVTLDSHGVARFVRIHQNQTLADGEYLLKFRKRGEVVRLASDAFFFEEGLDGVFRAARFGELKVDKKGTAVLVGVRDQHYQALGHQRKI